MRWEKEHPDIMRGTAAFVRFFANVPDPVVAIANRASTLESKMAWTLLGTCIEQGIPLSLLQKVLNALFENFPDEKLFAFPIPAENEIQKVVRAAKKTYDWPEEECVPGIFFSVGNFVRRRSPLPGWAASTSLQGILRDLGEIFFMGKGAYRPKAILSISRLFSPAPRGLGVLRTQFQNDISPVPFAFGIRRWIGLIGPGKEIGYAEMDETRKRKLALSLCKALARKDPRMTAHAFQFFLEPSEHGFICADLTANCTQCPLTSFCPKSFVGVLK
ncbi:hypothetical protein [Hallerella porci]|uniref:Iron-sulfur cluster loop n=1 Tax=Hallerella porci TaxID=1945871 RepID=A0ABX5LJQ8_9BACT|nr:hypothetical protein [Hallerella porci]PWK96630.1 hypothetical protein B0H50_11613 [Hallerella porci]